MQKSGTQKSRTQKGRTQKSRRAEEQNAERNEDSVPRSAFCVLLSLFLINFVRHFMRLGVIENFVPFL
jgi:hypothetical protein